MQGFPTDFWGKLHQDAKGEVTEWHPLVHHCADVAACCEALLRSTVLGRRLAVLAGQAALSEGQVARLAVLAVLHDAGKYNLGFQYKARRRSQRPVQAGHMGELLTLLGSRYRVYAKRLSEALDLVTLGGWGEDVAGLVVATVSHHGRPMRLDMEIPTRIWERTPELDPFAGLAELLARARQWYPGAWTHDGDPLPHGAEFQHAWSGLVMLGDWIGSDAARFFPFSDDATADRMPLARERARRALRELGLDTASSRVSLGPTKPGLATIAPGYEPRPAQSALLTLEPGGGAGSVAILEAETGSGKTEAALAYFARLFHAGHVDGLYFALPTRTAATQLYARVRKALQNAFPDEDARPPAVLAVPGYLEVDGVEGVRLAPFEVQWPENDRDRYRYRGWAAETPKRYLAGAVAVGTVDQALLSALMVSHAHLRASSLLRHLLVVDEVHASDAYMTRILESVLDFHRRAGGHALLMSATLGAPARHRLLAPPRRRRRCPLPDLETATATPYPLVTFVEGDEPPRTVEVPATAGRASKKLRFELSTDMEEPRGVAQRALDAAARGARVLVLRNTVRACRETQITVEVLARKRGQEDLLFTCKGIVAPHHARFAKADRGLLDHAIEKAFGRERPDGGCLAVATQTVQQSLDLDADFLITDLCPMDVLLQRIGRLHRHRREERAPGFEDARVLVLVPADPLVQRIDPGSGKAKGGHGLGGPIYEDLRVLEATWRLLRERPEVSIPEDNRRLVEGATHPEVLARIVQDGGEVWKKHQNQCLGGELNDSQLADLNLVRRNLAFSSLPQKEDVCFPEGDLSRRIVTRLGEGDRLVRFRPPIRSSFDRTREISDLRLAHHMVPAATSTCAEEAEEVHEEPGRVTFRFGRGRYTYDRLGLRRVAESQGTE